MFNYLYRLSTERVYQSHWRIWVDWTKQQQVDPCDPLVSQLCDFLLHLKDDRNFTQGTVKSYRWAICTTIHQSRDPDLSVDPLLKKLVTSLHIHNPHATPRIPQWDVYVMWEALKGKPSKPLDGRKTKYMCL